MTPEGHTSCPLCSAPSAALTAVADHFFGSPGVWEYRRCTAEACRVAFPSPSPTDLQLADAYSTYYTHEESGGTTLPGFLEAALTKFSMRGACEPSHIPLLGWLSEQTTWELGGLVPRDGLVADIGCGDGSRLARLLRAGWAHAVGVEPDPAAVRVAQEAGINVRFGSAENTSLENESADAVIMHHVIEHVRRPREAFAEAHRILKQGGSLAVVTPNIDSQGRDRWGAHWRGFEAPRHLTILTVQALGALALDTGFKVICNRSSARSSAWVDDVSARAAGQERPSLALTARVWRADHAFRKQSSEGRQNGGEEIVFVAHKE